VVISTRLDSTLPLGTILVNEGQVNIASPDDQEQKSWNELAIETAASNSYASQVAVFKKVNAAFSIPFPYVSIFSIPCLYLTCSLLLPSLRRLELVDHHVW
jgi:hypothetical protein